MVLSLDGVQASSRRLESGAPTTKQATLVEDNHNQAILKIPYIYAL